MKQDARGPLTSAYRVAQELLCNGLEGANSPRYTLFDDGDFAGEEVIYQFYDRLGCLFPDPLRIAALPFLPTCALRRPAIADLVAGRVLHRLTLLPAPSGANICPVMIGCSSAGRCDDERLASDSVSDIAAIYVLTITASWHESSITLSLLTAATPPLPNRDSAHAAATKCMQTTLQTLR